MRLGKGSAVVAAAALMLTASPAMAAPKVKEDPAPPACAGFMDNFSVTASDCRGFFDKSQLSEGNSDQLLVQETAIEQLLGISIPDGTYGPEDFVKVEGPSGDMSFDFAEALLGPVVIGFHFGGANGQANNVGNATGFFLFDFKQPTWNLTTDIPGFSAYIYYNPNTPPPSVPEPATWAMMLMGFGAAGTAMRRRRKAIAQIA